MNKPLLTALLALAALTVVPLSAHAGADDSSGPVGNLYFSIFDEDLYGGGLQIGGEWIEPETKAGLGFRLGYGIFMGSKGNEDPDNDLRVAMTGQADVYGVIRIFPWMTGYAGVGGLGLYETYDVVVPTRRWVESDSATVSTKGFPILPSYFGGIRIRLNDDPTPDGSTCHLFVEYRFEEKDLTYKLEFSDYRSDVEFKEKTGGGRIVVGIGLAF